MGADHCILVRDSDARSIANRVVDCLGGKPEFSIETSGNELSLSAAIYVRISVCLYLTIAVS